MFCWELSYTIIVFNKNWKKVFEQKNQKFLSLISGQSFTTQDLYFQNWNFQNSYQFAETEQTSDQLKQKTSMVQSKISMAFAINGYKEQIISVYPFHKI